MLGNMKFICRVKQDILPVRYAHLLQHLKYVSCIFTHPCIIVSLYIYMYSTYICTLVDTTAQEIQTQNLQENVKQDIIALAHHQRRISSQLKKDIML